MKIFISALLVLAASSLFTSAQVRWVKRYDGPAHNLDYAEDTKIDNNKVYVAGSSWGINTNTDFAVVKYDLASGSQEWVYRYNSPDSGSDNAQSLVFDNQGNLYVTGMVHHSTSSGVDIFTVSLTPTGGVRWIKEFTGSGNQPDQGLKIMCDNSRNVYVMGTTTTASGDFNIIVLKYSELGNLIWQREYLSAQDQLPKDMYVDKATGEVFVTGYTGNTNPDYLTFMISSTGSMGWVRLYGGSLQDISSSVGHDPRTGDIYVTGQTEAIGTGVAMTTVRYSRNGNELWHYTYNSPVSGGNAYGSDVESIGRLIYISGYSNEENTQQSEGIIVGIDSAGAFRWKTSYAARFGNFTSQNTPSDMKVDKFGRAYVSATVKDSAFGIGNNFMLIIADAFGNAYVSTYNSTFSDFTSAVAISNRYTVVTGHSDTTGQSSDMLTTAFGYGSGMFRNIRHKSIDPFGLRTDTLGPVIVPGNYGDAFPLMKVTLTIDTLLFPVTGDLEIYLVHNNIRDTIIFHNGGTGSNFIGTELNDSAVTPITSGSAPFTGSYRPYKPLAVFNAADVEGNWILEIKNTGSSSGILKGWSLYFDIDESTIGIQPVSNSVPGKFSLSQNYPNPFNPATTIQFGIPKTSSHALTTLDVYDITGRRITRLVNATLLPGTYKVNFDGSNYSSGIYFYTLSSGSYKETKKMVLVK